MKRIFFSLPVLLALGLGSFHAAAQDIGSVENEFRAFKKKLEASKQQKGVDSNSPAAMSAGSPAEAAPAPKAMLPSVTANPVASPLGPAANLPVVGQLPPAFGGAVPQTPEELQAQMEAEALVQQEKIKEMTFDAALDQLLPLKPEGIRKVLDTFKDSREAAETPIVVPQPKNEVRTISLDPAEAPATLLTSPGYVTTVTILDASGAPWPIQDVSWGGRFDISPPEEGGHIVRLSPQTAHGTGNLSVRLVDLITPITFSLGTGLEEVHYRFDARIPKNGPLAKTPLIEYGGLKTVAGTDDNLVAILDGTPDATAEKLSLSGVDGRTTAWRAGGKIYLRTPLALLSPAWDSSVASADGTNVYTLKETPVILLSDGGRMVHASIAAQEAKP